MKKYIFASMACLALFAACDDDYIDQFNIETGVTDVKEVAMTLSNSDYTTIAGNSVNKEIALALDPETESGLAALEEVGKKRYFTADAPADLYLPAFLASKYPNADLNSKFTVTYNEYQAPATYLADFANISTYTLTSDDYENVWGDKVKASFLSPESVGKIPAILAENVEAAEGDMMVVNYAYSETEPSIGGGAAPAEPTWTQVATIPIRSAGKNWDFVNMGPIDLSAYKGMTVNVGFKYTSTDKSGATWELKNFKALSVPYLDVVLFAKKDDGSFAKVANKKSFAGAGEYVIAAVGADAQYYPFGRLADGKTYGYMYPKAIAVENGVIAADAAADFVITLEATEAGFTMKNAIGQYLYMSGNYDSFNVKNEVGDAGFDWTIENTGSDQFVITNVEKGKSVKLNYYNGSYSFGSYAAEKVESKTYAANSLCGDEGGFTIYDVNIGSLSFVWQNTAQYGWKASAYVGGVNNATETYLVSPAIEIEEGAALPYITIDEAFRYGAGDASDITVWVSTDYAAAAPAMASTRAGVEANEAALYRYDGSAWAVYTNKDAQVAVVKPGEFSSASSDATTADLLPMYLAKYYPYALEGEAVVVVYNEKATEYTKAAEGWIETPASAPQTMTFTKDEDGITAKISVYLESSLMGTDGGFTAQDVKLTGGLSYIWTNTSSYGWKASSFLNSINNPAESWLVSPALDFRKGTAPQVTFDEAINYIKDADKNVYCAVKISTDYKGDVTTATWTDLELPVRADGASWNFVNVGVVDLSAYVGNVARLAFVYYVPDESPVGPTWEFKNILVNEKE